MLEPNVRKFLLEKLKEIDPDLDLRDGTAIVDLFINANSLIFQPLIDEINYIAKLQSLEQAKDLDDTSVDRLVGNLFVYRRGGTKAEGIIRLYFNKLVDVIVNTTDEFTTSEGLKFYPIRRYVFTSQYISASGTFDGTYYSVDINAQAEKEGEIYNIASNKIISTTLINSGLARVNNPFAFQYGIDRETNEELIDRAKVAITTRVLVTEPGIETQLLDNFNFIEDLEIVGYGDPEMTRDIINGDNIEIGDETFSDPDGAHIGGKTDVYIKTTIIQQKDTYVDLSKKELILREKKQDEDDTNKFFFDETNNEANNYIVRPIIFINSIEREDTGESLVGPTPECLAKEKIKPNRVTKGLNTTIGDPANTISVSSGEIIYNGIRYNITGIDNQEIYPLSYVVVRFIDNEPEIVITENEYLNTDIVVAKIEIPDPLGNPYNIIITDLRPDFDIIIYKPTLKNSINEEYGIYLIKDDLLDKPLRIIYTTCKDLYAVQDYINRHRTVCSDILAKCMLPSFLNIKLEYRGDIDTETLKQTIIDYIHNLPAGSILESADLVNHLYAEGVNYIKLPFMMKSITLNTDETININSSEDKLDLSRLVMFITNAGTEYLSETNPEELVLGIQVKKLD